MATEVDADRASAGAPELADLVPGSVLPGRFRIDALIATGSFGAVYRARQLTVERDVAVKVVRYGVDPASEDGRLFLHEIQTVARIDHPNVVRVYQADVTDNGRLFLAMELLAGRDLQAVVSDHAIAPSRAVAVTQQLLAALDAVHRAGIVHADVKPGNVLVTEGRDGERVVLVDFGLARLRRLDAPATSLGGTPAFMAPEQLRAGRVDARSDQFSAALVLVILLTGWHRRSARELAPPPEILAAIADSAVRGALTRALALAPDDRFASAGAFAAALSGDVPAPPARPPFHGLLSFTEDDRGRLHGRDRELARITELVLFRRLVILTAPSGVGKTSLLRAGLVPRLSALSTEAHYVSCRSDDPSAVAALLTRDTEAVGASVAERRGSRLVVVLADQVEAGLEAGDDLGGTAGRAASAVLDAVIRLGCDRRAGVNVVLSVREDFLARLLDRLPDRGDGVPITRVGPLDVQGARDAIVRPLAERQLAIAPDLLDQILAELTAAGSRLGVELGWSVASPVYPPHLQLACCVLHDRLPPGETTLSLAHYRALGGFDAIVVGHLERVLDELVPAEAATARGLFLALVSSTQLRSARTEVELVDIAGEEHRARVPAVLESLRRQGLIVRTRRGDGELVWELIHDSMVPRVLAWIDRGDLARRRAIELVRHHLRRTRPGAPSLLSRAELREIANHAGAIAALDAEWRRAHTTDSAPRWTPSALVARSRQIQRRSTAAAVALGLAVVAGLGAAVTERWRSVVERRSEEDRRNSDLGLVTFELAAYDWDTVHASAVPVAIGELPHLSWTLRSPSFDDPDEPGEELPPSRFRRFAPARSTDGVVRAEPVEAAGGAAFLVVAGRGHGSEVCLPSIIPLRGLPGYARRGAGSQLLRIRIPTCQASDADTIEIPAGPFVFGGPGEPAADQRESPERALERIVALPSYRIDRTEVSNAAFAVFGAMRDATGIAQPAYITAKELERSGDPQSPVSSVTWREAKAYCMYLGKHLPTSGQWEKAMRGGLTIAGTTNTSPRRNFPWGTEQAAGRANLAPDVPQDAAANLLGSGPQPVPLKGVLAVGSVADDRSPYGVVDMAGNLSEWVLAPTGYKNETLFRYKNWRVIRGGNWSDSTAKQLIAFTPIEHTRLGDNRLYTLGVRCVSEDRNAR